MEKISTNEVIQTITCNTTMSKKDVKRVLEELVKYIVGVSSDGYAVQINGLGKFYPQDSAPRTGIDPQTGEPLEIKFLRSVGFKAAAAAKKSLTGGGALKPSGDDL